MNKLRVYLPLDLRLALRLGLALTMLYQLSSLSAVSARPLSTLRYVALDGACASLLPCYASVQAAVDAADNGDVIEIATGVYTGVTTLNGLQQIAFITKSLTLRGGYKADFSTRDPQAYPTTLDAQGQGRVLYLDGSGASGSIAVTLDGLKITGGYWTGGENINGYSCAAGGGLRVQSVNLQVLNTTIVNNQVRTGLGSGLLQWQGTLTMTNSVIQNNSGDGIAGCDEPEGGGMALFQVTANIGNSSILNNAAVVGNAGTSYNLYMVMGGGLLLNGSTATIQNTLFQGNRANASPTSTIGGYGGGLAATGGGLTLLNSTFEANVANQNSGAGTGGGVYVDAQNLNLISGNLFKNNSAGSVHGRGGGLFTHGAVTIASNTFQSNTACTSGSNCDGGGAYLDGSIYLGGAIVFQNNTVISNIAGSSGGGVSIVNNSNYLTSYTDSITGNLFQGNTVNGGVGVGNGGGINITGSPINLVRNTFQDNSAGSYGGGLMQSGPTWSTGYSPTDLHNGNIFGGNTARYGGAMSISGGYVGSSYQNLVVLNNQASVNGSGIYFDHAGNYVGATLNFRHLTIGSNTGGDGTAVYVNHGVAAFTNTIIYNQAVGVQNLNGSPSFSHTLRYQVGTPTIGTVSDLFAITGDPAFTADGYHLAKPSAAVDVGISTPVTDDVDGSLRPLGQAPDLGAVESSYTCGIPSGVQATKQAGAPHWVLQWDPVSSGTSFLLQQDYLVQFSYGASSASPAITSFSVQDNLPTALHMSSQEATPAMAFSQDGNQLAWNSTAPLLPGSSGWVGILGQSKDAPPGLILNSTGKMDYSFNANQKTTLSLQASSHVPDKPLLPPVLISPKNGEMCLDEQGRLEASGLTYAGMLVKLFENGSLAATTTADASGGFTFTWISTLSTSISVNLDATVCDPAHPDSCSAPSGSVHLDYPLAFWCPQRSYWEGDVNNHHFVFHFVNEQGRYATNDFDLPGVYGFSGTQLHLYSCCDRYTNPFTVIADGTTYASPTGHQGRMWTFTIGAAHDVTIQSQCQGGGRAGLGRILIDPDGFVFDSKKGGQYDSQTGMFAPVKALPGITITAYVYVSEWDSWMPWPAELYDNQVNPQVTGADGYFAFFTPPGKYYLQATGADGFQSWRSPVIEVIAQAVHQNVPLTPWKETLSTWVTLTPGGISPAVAVVPAGGTVEWVSTLGTSPTVSDLAGMSENPILLVLSSLNPMTNILGFDGGMLAPGKVYRRQFDQPGTYAYSDGAGHNAQVVVVSNQTYVPVIKK